MLVCLTERKAGALADRESAAKWGSGAVRGDSVLSPAFAAEMAEDCERLDAHDPLLRRIAGWKLEGYSNAEIAAMAGKSLTTVERKLGLIRSLRAPETPA